MAVDALCVVTIGSELARRHACDILQSCEFIITGLVFVIVAAFVAVRTVAA